MKDTTGSGDVFLTIFGILNISKLFSVKEIAIISHIATGIHGSYLEIIKVLINKINTSY